MINIHLICQVKKILQYRLDGSCSNLDISPHDTSVSKACGVPWLTDHICMEYKYWEGSGSLHTWINMEQVPGQYNPPAVCNQVIRTRLTWYKYSGKISVGTMISIEFLSNPSVWGMKFYHWQSDGSVAAWFVVRIKISWIFSWWLVCIFTIEQT